MVNTAAMEKMAMALMDAHNDDNFPSDIDGIVALMKKATQTEKAQERVKKQLDKAKARVEKLEALIDV